MNMRLSKRRMLDLFEQPLNQRGFSRTEGLKFRREKNGVQQGISFPGRVDGGKFPFSVMLGIRFVNLQGYLGLSEQDRLLVPNAASPIHLLREDRHFSEWYLDDPNCVEEVLEQIDKYAIPFLDKYANLSAVKERLLSTYPGDWFILDPESRTCLLAAILVFEGNKVEAEQLLDKAILERKDDFPKSSQHLEELRNHLAQGAIRAAKG